MTRLLLLLLVSLLFPGFVTSAEAQDDQYIRIYSIIQEADSLQTSGKPVAALSKYRDAHTRLLQFQRQYPEWNNNVVKYRLSFLAAIIAEISAKYPAAAVADPTSSTTNQPSETASRSIEEADAQLKALQGQISQLRSDNSLLESKLKEALRVQPANVDPRALSRAEEEIKSLQKENALLKVNLAERPEPAAVPDSKALDQLKRELEEANRAAADARKHSETLASEKAALQKKMESLRSAADEKNLQTAQKALDEANRRLAEQAETTTRIGLERTALQERVKVLMAEAEALAALRAENEVLQKQLAELKLAAASADDKAAQELAEAKAQIAVLQSEQAVLQFEKSALEKQLKETPAPVATENSRVKELEKERDDFREKYASAQKELNNLRNKSGGAKVEQLQSEVELLRTRLAVMETQKVPYTEEEAAVIKKIEAAIIDPNARKKSSRNLPPGSMALVAEAQKDFAARRFDEAEEKYQRVLKQDENNVYTLANLAAIQIERNRFDDAEKNIQQALAAAPEDSYTLSLLGFLRFRQDRFDEALDALGRAARLDPQNAEIQNYLGLTLGQKGMRNAAESSLRKAITLDPNYGSAHYNLAVIYLTQKPQQVELARLHYKKALAAGMPPNIDMERMLNSTNGVSTP